jgi:ABC-type transport system involved in multi-copper enzyme maturation permease subunit
MKLWALAFNTFREAVRDRVLHSILFFGVAAVILSIVFKDITIGDQAKVVRSVAHSGVDVFASIIAMFLGISLLWKELEKKTIYTILSKPIPRWTFVLGKYGGLILTVAVELLLLVLIYTLAIGFQQGLPPLVTYVSFVLIFVELLLLTAWATLFSAYSAPMTATAFTLSIFVIGHLADDIWLYGSQAENPMVQNVAAVLYYVLPNFEVFNIRSFAIHDQSIPWDRVWPALGYGFCYTAFVLWAAVKVFDRRDIR